MSQTPQDDPSAQDAPQQIVVVGPDGQPIGTIGREADGQSTAPQSGAITDLVQQPAKVMRIGSMIKQLLDEVKSAPLDEAARARLREIHMQSITELEEGLAPELVEELQRLSLPFTDDAAPSDAELRIAQAQLVGWLEGLFHGIQAALFAQQMTAKAQFEEMRRQAGQPQLPPGQGQPGQPGMAHGTGQYL